MRTLRLVLLLLTLVLAYFLFYPVPVDPAAWAAPEAPPLEGIYAPNQSLAGLDHLFSGQCPQCEDVAVDSLGRLYGGAADGRILRFDSPADDVPDEVTNTGGRPLGLDFDRQGNLIVADARKGLLAVTPDGVVTVLATEHGSRRFGFTDDVEVAPDGIIYFSDASWKFPIEEYTLDLIEHRPYGRLLAYDPATRTTRLLLDSLYFANGVAVAADGAFVLVNETGAYRVRRYWLGGPRAGRSDVLIDNLPGFPDGISRGSDGIFWLALVSPRNSLLDALMNKPFLRKMLLRLPAALRPAAENYGFVLGVNAAGEVVHNLQDPAGGFGQITSVQEAAGYLYFGSLYEEAVGRVRRP